MASPEFTETSELVRIPASRLDPRTDDEIIAQLLTFQPVTSEKNIWTFWDTGLRNLRPYVLRFIIGWVRRLGPEWTVRVLDHVEGSPTSAHAYLPAEEFHDAFNKRTMSGPYAGAHSGDVVRLPLLYRYGGIWMDAGTMLFRHVDDICWRALADPASPYEIAGFAPNANEPDVIMNGFIAARKGSEFVKRWHRVYLELWKGQTDCIGMQKHPLLRQVKKVQVPVDLQVKFDIDNDLMNDYVAHVLSFKRVRMLHDGSFNGVQFWEQRAFVMPVEETFLGQILTGFNGQRMFDLLALPRESIKASERNSAAEELVMKLLSRASTMKLSHGLKNNKLVHLSKLWDLPENAQADTAPGTYAAFLSWGSIHLEQTREVVPLAVKCGGGILEAGLLEAVGTFE